MKPSREEMGNLLLETGLPETLEGVPIYADFRNMIRFALIMEDETLNSMEKAYRGVQQLFSELPEGDLRRALELLIWFYNCGRPLAEEAQDGGVNDGKPSERAFDYNVDAARIYASFLQTYGIDLIEVDFLHWWAFVALLENLPEDTAFMKVVQVRLMDLSEIKDKEMRAYYAQLKKQYSLEAPLSRELSLEEITRRNLERVDRRFAEAERRKREMMQRREGETM